MAERDEIQRPNPSEFSERQDSFSQRLYLLPPHFDREASNYKSTGDVTAQQLSWGENGQQHEGAHSQNAIAIISLLLIGVFVSNADGTLVLATYGTISSEFGAFEIASWLTTSYSLAMCALQPIVGKLSDICGRKTVILASYVLFAVGSVICGIAKEMWQVIAGRVVSGLGAAGMTVIVSVLITDLVPLIQIASWRSYVNLVATLGRSIGGPLGGLLADTVGWRWSFIGQSPLILLAIAIVAAKLPSQSPADHIQLKGQPSRLRRIDFAGAFMLATTIVSFLGALSLGGQSLPWSHPLVIGLATCSVILGSMFVAFEVRYASEPIFPPALVIRRDVATPYAVMTLLTAAQLGMMFTVPLYFRITQSSSNTEAGSHLFPAVLGNAVGGLLAGFLIRRTGRYRHLMTLGTISSSLSYFLLILRWNGSISYLESLEIIPGGFGAGMAAATSFIAVTSSVEKDEMAMATGGMYLASAVGMVIGVAVSSSVQLGSLRSMLVERLRDLSGGTELIRQVISDVGSIGGLDEDVRKVVVGSYVKSLEYSHMVSLGCSLLALSITLTIREHSLIRRNEEDSIEGDIDERFETRR